MCVAFTSPSSRLALNTKFDKRLSYRREIALQCGLIMAQSGRLELEDNILLTLQVYLQPLYALVGCVAQLAERRSLAG